MKIISLIMAHKLVTIVAVIIITILLLFVAFELGYISSIDDNAPIVQLTIYEAGTDRGLEGIIEASTDPFADNTEPLTAISTDIIGVIPNLHYVCEFVIFTDNVLPAGANPDIPLVTDISISGLNGNIRFQKVGDTSSDRTHVMPTILLEAPDYLGQANFTIANSLEFDEIYDFGSVAVPINSARELRGSDLDGSIWTIEIVTRSPFAGTDAYYGTETITLTLNVDNSGNVGITVSDVEFLAGEV